MWVNKKLRTCTWIQLQCYDCNAFLGLIKELFCVKFTSTSPHNFFLDSFSVYISLTTVSSGSFQVTNTKLCQWTAGTRSTWCWRSGMWASPTSVRTNVWRRTPWGKRMELSNWKVLHKCGVIPARTSCVFFAIFMNFCSVLCVFQKFQHQQL